MDDGLKEITEQATRLGEAIRRHPRYAKLREADERVRADKAATEALEAYNKAVAAIQKKGQGGQPIEVEDKRNLERLRQVVAGNEAIKAFMQTQADYAELMHRMNDTIYRTIAGPASEPAAPQK